MTRKQLFAALRDSLNAVLFNVVNAILTFAAISDFTVPPWDVRSSVIMNAHKIRRTRPEEQEDDECCSAAFAGS